MLLLLLLNVSLFLFPFEIIEVGVAVLERD